MADHVAGTLAGEAEETAIRTRTNAILFPLRLEARPFLKRLRHGERVALGRLKLWRGALQGKDLLILQTGVGPRRTLAALNVLSKSMPLNTVISAGFAGALNPRFQVGDVLAATHVVDEKMASVQATCLPQGMRTGRVLTMTRVIGDPTEKRQLFTRYQACAVDMESAFIGKWCTERGIRFGVVRAITDDAETSISPAVARLVSNQRLSVMSGVLGMAAAPKRSLDELLRLRRNALIAGERLAEVMFHAFAG